MGKIRNEYEDVSQRCYLGLALKHNQNYPPTFGKTSKQTKNPINIK